MRKHIIAVLTIVVCSLTLASISSAQDLKPPYDNPKEKNEKLSNLRFWEKQLKEYKNNKPKTQRELLQDKIDSKKAEAEKAKNNMLSEDDFATVNALEAEIKNLKDSLKRLPADLVDEKLNKMLDERDFLILDVYLLDILNNKCPKNFSNVLSTSKKELDKIAFDDWKAAVDDYWPLLENYEKYTVDLYRFMTSEKNKAMNIIFGADEKMPNNINDGFMSTLKKTGYYKYYQEYKKDEYATSIAYLNGFYDRIIEMKDSRLKKGVSARVANIEKNLIIEDLTIDSKEHMEELVAEYFPVTPKVDPRKAAEMVKQQEQTLENQNEEEDGEVNNINNGSEYTATEYVSKEQWLEKWEAENVPLTPNQKDIITEKLNDYEPAWNTELSEKQIMEQISIHKTEIDNKANNSSTTRPTNNITQPVNGSVDNEEYSKPSTKPNDSKVVRETVIKNFERKIQEVNVNANYSKNSKKLKELIDAIGNDDQISNSPKDVERLQCLAGDRLADCMMKYYDNNSGDIDFEELQLMKEDADYLLNPDTKYLDKHLKKLGDFKRNILNKM